MVLSLVLYKTAMSTTTPVLPLVVYTGATSSSLYSWSPFDTKLEARLRFSHRPYSVHQGSPATSPRGKIPYARIGDDGGRKTQNASKDDGEDGRESSMTLGDSTLITRKLIALGELEDLNARLSPVQKAQDLTIRALIEEKIYFIGVRAPIQFEWSSIMFTQTRNPTARPASGFGLYVDDG